MDNDMFPSVLDIMWESIWERECVAGLKQHPNLMISQVTVEYCNVLLKEMDNDMFPSVVDIM